MKKTKTKEEIDYIEKDFKGSGKRSYNDDKMLKLNTYEIRLKAYCHKRNFNKHSVYLLRCCLKFFVLGDVNICLLFYFYLFIYLLFENEMKKNEIARKNNKNCKVF